MLSEFWSELRYRLHAIFRRSAVEEDLEEELRFHIEREAEKHVDAGWRGDEAVRRARSAFGGVDQIKEECRDMRRVNLIDDGWKDVRHGVRLLRRSPGFTTAAVMTLALGIGAVTAIFSVVHGVLLKPLPFHEPDRLVGLYHRAPGIDLPALRDRVLNQGPATYFTYVDHQRVFEGIGAWDRQSVSITGRSEPERVEALAVSDGVLPLLRVQPVLGRLFTEEDDTPGSPPRVVLTHGYWQRRFGGADDVIGRTLEIDGVSADIIGVLPSTFRFLRTDPSSYKFISTDPEVFLPLQPDRRDADGISFGFQVLARMRPGVTLAEANADVARMIPTVEQIAGHAMLRLEPNVRPLVGDEIGDVGRTLWIVFGTVGIMLLIACTNVANLFLVRAEGRRQELTIRAALGATRGRIARALLAESLLLGLAGGGIGLLIAGAAIGLLRRLAFAILPRVDEIGLDPVVLLFALAASVLTSLLFGLVPVLRSAAPSATALKEGGRSSSDGPDRHRTRNTFVVAEVAMALVLLVVSGLMVRTFVAMRQVEPGFVRPEEVQTFRIEVPEALIRGPQEMAQMHDQIAERLRQVPGVASVGLSSHITLDGEDNTNPLVIEHSPVAEGELPPLRRYKTVAPGYFETMGNRLIAGRGITWTDIYEVRPVVVISESLAREHWRNPSEALGRRVRGPSPTWYEIVGVVGNERDDGLDQPATAIVYWPMLNDVYQRRAIAYAVRSNRVGTPSLMRELQQAVWSVNSNLPLANIQTLEEIHSASMARTSFAMVMLAIAASVALLLGVVGIYGVISYTVVQRTREIGLRMALGAQTGDVRRLFVLRGLVLTGIGIALGIGASLAVTRVMSTLLFGVDRMDPVTYAAVSAGLIAVALLATWLPARRASGIDPNIALRSEA